MCASAPVQYDYYDQQRFGSKVTERHDCSLQLPVIGTSKREEWMAWIGDMRKHGGLDSQPWMTVLLIRIKQKMVCNRVAWLSHMAAVERPKGGLSVD